MSHNKNLFTQVQMKRPGKSVFNLSHDHKLSCNMGDLVPVLALDLVPGDKVSLSQKALARLMPMVAPMMHRVDVRFETFFVPNRLTWKNFEKFIMQEKVDGTIPAAPYFECNGFNQDFLYTKLCDHFGIPARTNNAGVAEQISLLPFAAYQLIWNTLYRDQNLQPEVECQLYDGLHINPYLAGLLTMRKRAWEHDYFTSALPFAQKGDPVAIPMADFNDVPVRVNDGTGGGLYSLDGTPNNVGAIGGTANGNVNDDFLYADTSQLQNTATTINDLRRAFRLQEWFEKKARGGSRYAELILSFFGVKPEDYRLQRPEMVTGTKSPIQISEVLNTTGTEDAPQGTMSGHGITAIDGNTASYYAKEHGYLITIMSVMPRTAYQQGIPKHFQKFDPLDYYWPQFANIGEQQILNREVFAYTNQGGDTFGYTPRYSEYKYMANRVSGQFRDTLNFWHMGRIFDTIPALNASFIQANPTHRVFAVTDPDDDKILMHVFNQIRAVRPMPFFGTPTI